MKILVLSDLHLESTAFEPDGEAIKATDVIVLAGDIHPGDDGIRWARETFPGKPVIYVAGNHEFYGGDWNLTLKLMRETAKVNNVYFLENDSVMIGGVRFLGCTLWTDFEYFGKDQTIKAMNYANSNFLDYKAIEAAGHHGNRLTAAMTLQRHRDSRAWLEAELPKGNPGLTVVVTHHYPHQNSTAPEFKDDPLTPVFGSKLPEKLLLQSAFWIHGHAHSSLNYRLATIGRVMHVVCNPRGYSDDWTCGIENKQFEPGMLLEIFPRRQEGQPLKTPRGRDELILYLDFDGVLHHENVYWYPRRGAVLKAPPGHVLFQHVGLLEEILAPYPGVQIVLSTSWARVYGCDRASKQLPSSLRSRVIGATFHSAMDDNYFTAAPRGMQVWSDVLRRKPRDWLALDDDYLHWPAWCRDKYVRTHEHEGISAPDVEAELRQKIALMCSTPTTEIKP